jgi:hypothetical protein
MDGLRERVDALTRLAAWAYRAEGVPVPAELGGLDGGLIRDLEGRVSALTDGLAAAYAYAGRTAPVAPRPRARERAAALGWEQAQGGAR